MQTVKRLGTDFPRRNCLDLATPAEKSLWDAMQAVEAAGAHPWLTDAINLIEQAKQKVADFVELPGSDQTPAAQQAIANDCRPIPCCVVEGAHTYVDGNCRYCGAQQATPAVPHRAPYDVEISGGKETIIPAVQSDADLARDICKECFNCSYVEYTDIYGYDRDELDDADFDTEKAEALIAQHVQARTKPLVAALADMEGGLELMRMAIMGHADRTELTKRVNFLIKDCQKWQALAQEKGQADG